MAVPGSWTLTGLVPDCDFFQLPVLLRPLDADSHKRLDGKPGQLLNEPARGQAALPRARSVARSRTFNWYSTKQAARQARRSQGPEDPQPGGAGMPGAPSSWAASPTPPPGRTCRWRCRRAPSTACSTDESCGAAKLWEAGVKYASRTTSSSASTFPSSTRRSGTSCRSRPAEDHDGSWAQTIGDYRRQRAASSQRPQGAGGATASSSSIPTAGRNRAPYARAMMTEQDHSLKEIKISPRCSQELSWPTVGTFG